MEQEYNIRDILDIPKISGVLESFSQLTNTVTAILDLEGNILVKSGWRDICTLFHRVHPKSSQNCKKSDTILTRKLSEQSKYNVYKCLNGLIDIAVPIIIREKHIGNLFTGQFFFKAPDYKFFKSQAAKYNFDEEKYLQALSEVPVIEEDEIEQIVKFLLNLTEIIVETGLNSLKQLEMNKALEESRIFNETLLNTSPEIIYVYDIRTRMNVYSNDGITKILGYSKEDMAQMGEKLIEELMDPEDFQHYKSSIIPQYFEVEDGEFIEHDYRMKHKNGNWLWLKSKETIFSRDKTGDPVQIFGIITDITETKTVQAEILKMQRILQETGKIAKIGGWEFDPVTGEGTWTDEVARIHDLNPKDPTNKEIGLSFYTPESKKIIEQAIILAIEEKKPYDLELELVTAKGIKKWVRTIGKPIIESGKVIKVTGSFQDISEIKRTEEDLRTAKEKAEESDKLKTAFLANMSHEIRTPMNGILGFANLLKNPDITKTEMTRYIDVINRSGKRMLNIISDLIDIAKIETGQIELLEEKFDLNILIKEIHAFFYPEAKNRGLKLEYLFGLDRPGSKIKTDKTKLTQIFTNLIGNALKFTEKGEINFGYHLVDDKLLFFVKDTGRGISDLYKHRIFERFIQEDITPTKVSEGSGLGLSITKAFIEKMGGNIWVESIVTKGSEFYFRLPYIKAVKTEQEIEINTHSLQMTSAEKTVLIAEDDEISFMLLQELLEGNNLQLLRARNGREAVEEIQNNSDIDLVLIDIKMPLMNGLEATRQIKKLRPLLPIIAQSAYVSNHDRKAARTAGCNDFIEKPVRKSELYNMIEKYVK